MSTLGDPLVLLAAVGLDLLMGEPPNRLHPVGFMGWLIQALRKRAPIRGRWQPLLAGLGIVTLGLALSAGVGALVWWLRAVPLDWMNWIGLVLEVLLVKSTFSLRGLAAAASAVHRPLQAGDIVAARRLLAWHLVSRDTTDLDEARVAAAVVESVAENTSDSVVAPWLFYLAGGLPAALAYRFVNTADALLGYRDAKREWLGKVPARLDDLLNLLPARLTAVCILLGAPLVKSPPHPPRPLSHGGERGSQKRVGGVLGFLSGSPSPALGEGAGGVRETSPSQEGACTRFRRGLVVWWHDAGRTASPNAGHPMAAAAGVLGIELEKLGHYRLGAGLALPRAADIERVLGMLRVVAGMNLAVVIGIALLGRGL